MSDQPDPIELEQQARHDRAKSCWKQAIGLGHMGELAAAEKHYRQSLAEYGILIDEQMRADLRIERVKLLTHLVILLRTGGKLDAVEDVYRLVLDEYKILIDKQHQEDLRPELCQHRFFLANFLRVSGRLNSAEELYRQGLAEYAVLIDELHRTDLRFERAQHSYYLGTLLRLRGEFGAAKKLYRQGLVECEGSIQEQQSADLRLNRVRLRRTLGILLRTGREFEADDELNWQGVAEYEFVIGDCPPDDDLYDEALHCCKSAYVSHIRGQLDAAENLYWQGLRKYDSLIKWKGRADLRPERAKQLCNLATVLSIKGDLDASEMLYRQGLVELESVNSHCGIDERQLADLLPDKVKICSKLAIVLRKKGALTLAEKIYRKALDDLDNLIDEKLRTDLRPDRALLRCNLALVLSNRDQREAANKLYRQGLAEYEIMIDGEQRADLRPTRAKILGNLAVVLGHSDELEAADELFRLTLVELNVLIEDYRRTDLCPDRALHRCNLANVLSKRDQKEAAEKLYRQGLAEYEVLISQMQRVDLRSYRAVKLCNLALLLYTRDKRSAAENFLKDGLAEISELIEQKNQKHLSVIRANVICMLAKQLKFPEFNNLNLNKFLTVAVGDTTRLVFTYRQAHVTRDWREVCSIGLRLLISNPEPSADLRLAVFRALAKEELPATGSQLWEELKEACRTDLPTLASALPVHAPLRSAHTQMLLRWLQELLSESPSDWMGNHATELEHLIETLWEVCRAQGANAIATWFFRTQGLQALRRALWSDHPHPDVQRYFESRQELGALQEQLLAHGRFNNNPPQQLIEKVQARWQTCKSLRTRLTEEGLLPEQVVDPLHTVRQRLKDLAQQRKCTQAVCLLVRSRAQDGVEPDSVSALLLWATAAGDTGLEHKAYPATGASGSGTGSERPVNEGGPRWDTATDWLVHADDALASACRNSRGGIVRPRRGFRHGLAYSDQPANAASATSDAANSEQTLQQVAQCWSTITKPLATWLQHTLARTCEKGKSLPCVHLLPADDLHQIPWHHCSPWPAKQLRVWPTLGDWLRHSGENHVEQSWHWGMASHDAMSHPTKRLPMVALETALTKHLWGPGFPTMPAGVLDALTPEARWPSDDEEPVDVLLSSGHGGDTDSAGGSQAPVVAGSGIWMGDEANPGLDVWLNGQTLSRVHQPVHWLVMACVLGKTDDWLGEPLGPIAAAFGQKTRFALGWLVQVDDLAACLASLSLQYALKNAKSLQKKQPSVNHVEKNSQPGAINSLRRLWGRMVGDGLQSNKLEPVEPWPWIATVLAVQSGWLNGRWPDGFGNWLEQAVKAVGPALLPGPDPRKPAVTALRTAWLDELAMLRRVALPGNTSSQATLATISQANEVWDALANAWSQGVPHELRQMSPYLVILGEA